MSMLETLRQFAWDERNQYALTPAADDNNRFAFAFNQIGHYRRHLETVYARYVGPSARFADDLAAIFAAIRAGIPPYQRTGMLTEEEKQEVVTCIYLGIESFYLFARILLDNTAKFLTYYFGPIGGEEFISHAALSKAIDTIEKDNRLSLPVGFTLAVHDLKNRITPFRNDHVTHDKTIMPVRGLSSSASDSDWPKEVSINKSQFYPKGDYEQINTEPLGKLLASIDGYLAMVMELIRTNRARSVLKVSGEC